VSPTPPDPTPPLPTTPSQTVGPYLHLGLPWPDGPHAVDPGTPGAVEVRGVVLDGAGLPIPDALVETWQAGPDGGFDHAEGGAGGVPGFRGFARVPTAEDGSWRITTLKPGRVASADGPQAPHLDVSVFARGLLHRVVTRIYFGDEPAANAEDPLLRSVDPARRGSLVAGVDPDGGYRHAIRLQGPDETVFFVV
jgi:protocatechuate 3,4-dioxygenase alpha subunit